MSTVTTTDMESGVLATEFPGGQNGTYTFITPPGGAPTNLGSLCLRTVVATPSQWAIKDHTGVTNYYIKFCFYLELTANPTGNIFPNIINIKSTADATIAYVDSVVTSAGVFQVRLNNSAGGVIGSPFTTTPNAWHTMDIHLTVAASNATLEMRVDEVVQATSAVQNTGTVAVGRYSLAAGTSTVTGTMAMLWDAVIVDDAVYPSYAAAVLTPNVNDAMGVGDQRYTQV